MTTETSSNTKDKFILRFPDENQRAALKSRAALNRRTMNAEILFLIEKGLKAEKGNKNAAH